MGPICRRYAPNLLAIGYIEDCGVSPAPQVDDFSNDGVGAIGHQIIDEDVCSMRGEQESHTLTDTLTGSTYDRGATG